MKISRLKLMALVSGCILLVVLMLALIKKNESIVDNTDVTQYNIMDKELLCIQPIAGETAEDIQIEYDVTGKTFTAYMTDENEVFDDGQIDYGSPLIASVVSDNEEELIRVTVKLKDYCTYSSEINNNALYIHFEKIDKNDNKLIVIDPGHGGYDVGAQNGDIYEKDINLSVANYLCDILEKNGYIPIMTRNSDVFVSVEDRVDFANNMSPRMFISIHCNDNEDSSAQGTEVLYNIKDTAEKNSSLWLSKILLESVTSSVGTRKRDVISGNSIHIVRSAKIPMALVEMGFMSNEKDLQILSTSQGQKRFAQGIAEGIIEAMTELKEMETKNE